MNKEYAMLREEILLSMQTIKNYNNLLYSATTALLAFAFALSREILFLLPFAVILPLYFLIKREMMQVVRIGAYMSVFLEEKLDIHWESRLISYDAMFFKNKHRRISLNAYTGLSFLCVFLSVMHTDYAVFGMHCKILLAAQASLTIISILLFIIQAPNYTKIKREYLAQWKKIKSAELAENILKR